MIWSTANPRSKWVKDLRAVRLDDIGPEIARRACERYGWTGDDFGSVSGQAEWLMGFERDGWKVSTVTDFQLHAELDAYEGDERVASYAWNRTVPRDLS